MIQKMFLSRLSFIIGLFLYGFSTYAQVKDNARIPEIDGEIFDMEQVGDTMFIAGSFNGIRHRDSTISHLYISDTALQQMRSLNLQFWSEKGPVQAAKTASIIDDGQGGWILSGDFNRIGDSVRNFLAQIDSNGKVTSLFSGLEFDNRAQGIYPVKVKRFGDTLFIFGNSFLQRGKEKHDLFVREEIDTTLFYPFQLEFGYPKKALPDDFGGYYIAGDFQSYAGSRNNGFVHIDSAGNSNGEYENLLVRNQQSLIGQTDQHLIFHGNSELKNTKPVSHLYYSGLNSSPDTVGVSPVLEEKLLCVASKTKDYYVVGEFEYYGGQRAHGIVRIDSMHQVHPWTTDEDFYNVNYAAANSNYLYALRKQYDSLFGGEVYIISVYNAHSGKLLRKFHIDDFDYIRCIGADEYNFS
ncbi:MAG: hypothetical protein GC180_11850 [Bacteroidetes bacterium]|nr:hypothetical protein [Bacteroidota bacterium]